ncbi:MAG: sensor histidine kinase, partial [Longimicrobiales bacterium]
AVLIGAGTLLYREAALGTAAALPGAAALAASACVFLAFSGSIRLTRSGQQLATSLALADWALIAWISGLRLVPAAAIAVILLATGIFGARYTTLIRRVVADEVARRSLDRLYRDAQAAVWARQEVLQKVAHDLRAPLAAIRGYAELLLDPRHPAQDGPTRLTSIVRSSDAMNRLISDLLDIARMEAGEIRLERRSTRPRELVERALETMAPIAAGSEVALCHDTAGDLPRLHVDPDRVAQIFSNLVGNAVKFTPHGGRVTIGASRLADAVRFAVTDTGPGIPAEQVSQIFERFWQANVGDRRGIGIGLAIARSIVEAHGGRIGVDTPPIGGSEFWFTIPIAGSRRNQPDRQAGTSGRSAASPLL